MIANSEAVDPESLQHCYVGTLVYMYEMSMLHLYLVSCLGNLIIVLYLLGSNKKDPFRAQVQWYSRVEQLPKKLRAINVDPPLEENWEVVHEGQRYNGDLSIETIFGKCSILDCDINEVPTTTGRQKKSWVFFCRFAFGPKAMGGCFVSIKDSKNGNECLPLKSAKKESSAVKSRSQPEATPTRVTRTRKVSENEENEGNVINTPKSARRSARTPSRYTNDQLPSPLKNSTFSVSSAKSKELCIVIQRREVKKDQDEASETDVVSHTKARKKLNLEDSPTKVVSSYLFLFLSFCIYLIKIVCFRLKNKMKRLPVREQNVLVLLLLVQLKRRSSK